MTGMELVRRIAADPTSVALLLAGPGVALWPGGATSEPEAVDAHEHDGSGGRGEIVDVETPPQRTPTSFVTRFRVSTADGTLVSVSLRLDYDEESSESPDSDSDSDLDSDLDLDKALPRPATQAHLWLTGPGARDLAGVAGQFLDALAQAAEDRSRAA